MNRENAKIQDCLQNEPAFCTAACPFHLDVRDFIEKIQRGSFNAAYRSYLNTVGFPGIVTAICDEPCKNVCPRREKDAAISLRLLEKASIDFARNTDPNNYNIPLKDKKIAIIGAGISGLACALRLSAKKYDVTVFDRTDRIGGHLWELLPSEVFLKDIEHQFMYEKYTLCLNTEITSLDDLNFDAFYVATGAGGNDFGLASDLGGAFASTKSGVFLGGSLMGRNSVQAIADGLQVSNAIERYIKTNSMNQPWETGHTKLELDPSTILYSEAVLPKDGVAFTREEAILEAKRCLKCSCNACVRYCDLMHYFKKFPKRIAEEVELTIHPGTLDGNGTLATRFISTCNQCGLCKEVCPIGIDTGDFLLINHRIMREKGAMPWVFHDFWLRDMEFSNSADAQLAKIPIGYSQSNYVFFPGCQLGASDPQYVIESYRWLLAHKPDTAIMLNCCGAPAEWAGDVKAHEEVITKLRDQWLALGKPITIFACPNCKQMFDRYLPEIKGVFLYDLILEWGIPSLVPNHQEIVSIFDPCSSREEPGLQQTIRQLVKQAGFTCEPLFLEGRLAACCSWGGQVSITNPRYAHEVISARITQNDYPYITYCINCRDIFAASQKPVYHILDIVFGLHDSNRKPPTLTERRYNRAKQKQYLLREFWKDDTGMEPKSHKILLNIPPQLKQKLSDEMILETEIEAVIEHCESSGRKVLDPTTGHFFGHLQIGNMTYWVEYLPGESGYDLVNAYSHRMSIDEA
ncbi:MAG: pyridine nucleotide-disulfide oxidoreductase/dicluster-binding protein [Anaerolineaceae bacterium]